MQVPGILHIDSNDLDPAVCASMRRNVAFNGPEVAQRIKVLSSDARIVMMQNPLVRTRRMGKDGHRGVWMHGCVGQCTYVRRRIVV